MALQHNDEIDLGYILDKINGVFKNISIGVYNGIQFLFRNWYIVLGLLVAGVLLGYFSEKDLKPGQTAKLVIRTNFNTAEYTYNALQTLKDKSQAIDSTFLLENGFRVDKVEIGDLEITPIINFRDVSENYDSNNRAIETLLRNIEFKDEEAIPNSLYVDYKYHEVELSLSPYANKKTLETVFTYLNNNKYVKNLALTGKNEMLKNIEMNEFSIRQIDSTLSKYNEKVLLASSNNQIAVVDKNYSYSYVVAEKSKLQKENTQLKNDLVYADAAIIQINNDNIIKVKTPIYKKKAIVYPVFFIFLFIFFSWMISNYKRIKILAETEKAPSLK